MTRCDPDAVFYRVFCVTLLAVAFTFTVILTNVFIDIDGFLSNKRNTQPHKIHVINDDKNHEVSFSNGFPESDDDNAFRTKRSIETNNLFIPHKSAKVKTILTTQLAALLQNLDEENEHSKQNTKTNVQDPKSETENIARIENSKNHEINMKESDNVKNERANLLQLTMQNILLQGIVGHMDLKDVMNRANILMSGINTDALKSNKYSVTGMFKEITPKLEESTLKLESDEKVPVRKELDSNVLNNLFNGKYQSVNKDIEKSTVLNKNNPNIKIKTIVDILTNDDATKNTSTKKSIQGIFELMYDGKTIKYNLPKPETPKETNIQDSDDIQAKPFKENSHTPNPRKSFIELFELNKEPNFIKELAKDYFRSIKNSDISEEIKRRYETKRMKRHIKIKYDTVDRPEKSQKSEDDELYVEIETHIDSKGSKGEKKKKIIQNLINKIEKALHSTDGMSKNKKGEHIKKRLQDPLEHKNHELLNKYTLPVRNLMPNKPLVDKVMIVHDTVPLIGDKTGNRWMKPIFGPSFLSASKKINSAEMSEVDVDYNKILDANGIPQRLQRPLHSDTSEETSTFIPENLYDLGDMKILLKDIEGTGFAIGYNQYVDETPDADTMKLFTGLENVIKMYHQNYDEPNINIVQLENDINNTEPEKDHVIVRRSIDKQDYHSNAYKIIFEKNFLPFSNYRDVLKGKKSNSKYKNKIHSNHIQEVPLVIDDKIFEKKLNPAEIFSLANLFQRKKRAINVKRISNTRNKMKVSRYLNTKAMARKKIFRNYKRSKRQINKIRIIASDARHLSAKSEENYASSNENMFADRATIKDIEAEEENEREKEEESYSEESSPPSYIAKLLDLNSRRNSLMAKYPHVFLEEVTSPKEQSFHENLMFRKIPHFTFPQHYEAANPDDSVYNEETITISPLELNQDDKSPKIQGFVDVMTKPKTKYKVTLKIIPKNVTDLNAGFKEIHTSINKRFNKDGLVYSSLVNVSEISKVTQINNTKDQPALPLHMKEQQQKMHLLLKEHQKHISEQLKKLNEEKSKIDTILHENEWSETPLNYLLSEINKPKAEINIHREHVIHTAPNELLKTETKTTNTPPTTTISSTIKTTTQSTTSTSTTIATTSTEEPKSIKNNIIQSMERNQNLTDQILKKIDENTEVLQLFLKKLSDRVTGTDHTTEIRTVDPQIEVQPHIIENNIKDAGKIYTNNFNPDWKNPIFNTNMVIRKNGSHITIPFVYAYQHPIMPNKKNADVANVVYQGHIHTLRAPMANGSPEKHKIQKFSNYMLNNNQTKFFIDEFGSNFSHKVMRNDIGAKKNHTMS